MIRNLTPDLINKLDRFAPSPDAHASKVYQHLKEWDEFDNYQLQCFCIEFLGSQMVTGELMYAQESIKQLAKDFYFAHYLRVAESVSDEWKEEEETLDKEKTIEDGTTNGQ